MTLDPGINAVLKQMSALPQFESLSVKDARGLMAKLSVSRDAPLAIGTVEDHMIETDGGSLPVRVYSDVECAEAVLVFFHGGGWVLGNLDGCDAIARHFAKEAQVCIVSVDYRLAPENPFPAAVQDGLSTLVWTEGLRGRLITADAALLVGGESSGANLATVVALLERDEGKRAVDGQLLFYPVTNCDFDTPSYHEHGEGLFVTRDAMQWFWDMYAPDEKDRSDFRASPLRTTDLSNLGRIFLQTAEFDPIRDEGEAYAKRLAEAGNDVVSERRAGLIHGFLGMAQVSPTIQNTINDAVRWIRDTVKNR